MKWHDLLERLPVQNKLLELTYHPVLGWTFSIDGTPSRTQDVSCEYAVLRGVFEYLIRDQTSPQHEGGCD